MKHYLFTSRSSCFLLVSLAWACSPSAREASASAADAEASVRGHGTGQHWRAGWSLVRSESFTRALNKPLAKLEPGEDQVVLSSRERDPASGVWHVAESVHAVPFRVRAVDSRTADDLFLVGRDAAGRTVVERWLVGRVTGAWYAERPVADVPLGTPFATPPTTLAIEGGIFVPPESRPAPQIQRERLWEGTALGEVTGLLPDPDGRFVLLLGDGGKSLWRLSSAGGVPALLATDQELPTLEAADEIHAYDHESAGRVWVVRNGFSNRLDELLVFFDTDNDGLHEDVIVLDEADGSWAASGLPQGWVADYLNHY